MDNKPNFSRGMTLQWAGSRERNLGSGRGRTFFLTSLFRELIENCRAPAFRASGLDTRKQRSVSVMAIFHQPVTSSARNVALRVADARRRARQLATENVGGQRKENKNDVDRKSV